MNYLHELKKNGYCIIKNSIDKIIVDDILLSIKEWYDKTKNYVSKDTPFLNRNQHNVYNLQNKDIKFIDLLLNVREVEDILIDSLNDKWYKQISQNEPNYILRSFGARSSNDALPLHIDSFIPYIGNETIAMQVVIVLEDMTHENGCTIAIPGSHQSGNYANNEALNDAIKLTPEAGDIVIWDSRLWHGTNKNITQSSRWAIVATFTRWWIKQHFEITESVPLEIYNQLSPKYRSILGYCSKPWKDEYEGIEIKKGYDYVTNNSI